MTMPDERIANPVPVEIKNWAEPAKPPYVKNTTLKTYILDPLGAAGPKSVQITDYEPRRMRLVVIVVDAAIAILTDPPIAVPDTSTASLAPQGLHLPISTIPVEFFGPDAMWLNNLGTVTRVSVIKEYC